MSFMKEWTTEIISIIMFIAGMFSEHYRAKRNNKREKAKDIDTKTLPELKALIDVPKSMIDSMNFIELNETKCKAKLKLEENYFIDKVPSYGIFKIENDYIALSYVKDKVLNKHISVVLQCFNDYKNNVHNLEQIVSNLSLKDIPSDFETNIRKLIVDEFKVDGLEKDGRKDWFLFILFVYSLTGSTGSYQGGRMVVGNLITQCFPHVEQIVKNNNEALVKYNLIEYLIKQINSSLARSQEEIQALHDEWQNKFMI